CGRLHQRIRFCAALHPLLLEADQPDQTGSVCPLSHRAGSGAVSGPDVRKTALEVSAKADLRRTSVKSSREQLGFPTAFFVGGDGYRDAVCPGIGICWW